MLFSLLRLLREPFKPIFMWVLVGVNLLGSIYGYYWYAGQLADTPWYYWPFTPDSPLSTTMFMITLLFFLCKKNTVLFPLVAYAGVIKYGLWAVVINLHYWQLAGTIPLISLMLALSHLGMAAEGYVYIRHLQIRSVHIVILALWLAFNDFLDYALGIHPYLFYSEQWTLALISAVTLSFLIIIFSVSQSKKPVPPRISEGLNF